MGCGLSDFRAVELPTLKVVMFGLDGAGKSTILHYILNKQLIQCQPTLGVQTFAVTYNDVLKLVIFDVSGHARNLWDAYFQSIDAAVFVFDITRPDQIDTAKYELQRIDRSIRNVQLLIFLNKQDIAKETTFDNEYWVKALGISQLRNDAVVERSSGKTGFGIKLGFSKLLKLMEQKFTGQVLQKSPKTA